MPTDPSMPLCAVFFLTKSVRIILLLREIVQQLVCVCVIITTRNIIRNQAPFLVNGKRRLSRLTKPLGRRISSTPSYNRPEGLREAAACMHGKPDAKKKQLPLQSEWLERALLKHVKPKISWPSFVYTPPAHRRQVYCSNRKMVFVHQHIHHQAYW